MSGIVMEPPWLTAGDLRKLLANVPDDREVVIEIEGFDGLEQARLRYFADETRCDGKPALYLSGDQGEDSDEDGSDDSEDDDDG